MKYNYKKIMSAVAVSMPAAVFNKHCAFCSSHGVAGPHDHWLRATKDPRSAVTCPRLKDHTCQHCGRKGHTAKFCGEKRFLEGEKKQALAKAKRESFENGDWDMKEIKVQRPTNEVAPKPGFKVKNTARLAPPRSQFAGLEIDSCGSSDEDDQVKNEVAAEIKDLAATTSGTWAAIAAAAPKPVLAQQRLERRLSCGTIAEIVAKAAQEAAPPQANIVVTWGTARTMPTRRWADASDDEED